jgi:hypothetical protein
MALSNSQISLIVDDLGYPYQAWVINWVIQRVSLLTSSEQEDQIIDLISKTSALRLSKQQFILDNAGKQIDGNSNHAYFRGGVNDYDNLINQNIKRVSILLDIPFNKSNKEVYINS